MISVIDEHRSVLVVEPIYRLLSISDFTYVTTWQGFVHVAFVIDAFARCIVGWRASGPAQTPNKGGAALWPRDK